MLQQRSTREESEPATANREGIVCCQSRTRGRIRARKGLGRGEERGNQTCPKYACSYLFYFIFFTLGLTWPAQFAPLACFCTPLQWCNSLGDDLDHTTYICNPPCHMTCGRGKKLVRLWIDSTGSNMLPPCHPPKKKYHTLFCSLCITTSIHNCITVLF